MEKLPKGYGYVVRWARASRTQEELARQLTDDPSQVRAIESAIKNYEGNRIKIPVPFLTKIGNALGYRSRWWEHVPPSLATTMVAEGRREYPARSSLPAVRLPIAPRDRSSPLRISFLTHREDWNRFRPFPSDFGFQGFRPYVKDEVGAAFPIMLADEVYPEDPDVDGEKIAIGDDFVIRTDVVPALGCVVSATGRNGERYRRQFVVAGDRHVLRHLDLRQPDVPVNDVAAIEGLVIGRLRRFPERQGFSAVFVPSGLSPDDL